MLSKFQQHEALFYWRIGGGGCQKARIYMCKLYLKMRFFLCLYNLSGINPRLSPSYLKTPGSISSLHFCQSAKK